MVSQGLPKKTEREARLSHTLRFCLFLRMFCPCYIAKGQDLISRDKSHAAISFFHKWQQKQLNEQLNKIEIQFHM